MTTFDSKKFVANLADELLKSFDNAKDATTPGLKGAARENLIRKRLENLLPSGVGIGSGCVIDHLGNVSKQQDVILYEKEICPIFSIADTPEATYYPCEGVIAVGEIKTKIGKKEIEDSFSKIKSVKILKRFLVKSTSILRNEEMISFRKYLNRGAFDCAKSEEFDQEKNTKDQIYGFILCYDFDIKIETLLEHISNLAKEQEFKFLPNIFITLNGGIVCPYNTKTSKLCLSINEGDSYVHGYEGSNCNFEYLIAMLYRIIQTGRSVEISAFDNYIINDPQKMSLTRLTHLLISEK